MKSGCTLLIVGLCFNACPPLRFNIDVGFGVHVIWIVVVGTLFTLGVWRVTTRESDRSQMSVNDHRAAMTRIACVVFVSSLALATLLSLATIFLLVTLPAAIAISVGIAMISCAVLNWHLCNHLGQYAMRTPDSQLHQVTSLTKWLFSIGLCCFGVIGLLAPIVGEQSERTGFTFGPYTLAHPAIAAIGGILAGMTMIGGLCLLVVLWDYRGAFKRAADFANDQLASNTPAP